MARGIGNREPEDTSVVSFWSLPEDVQARIEAWACATYQVENFFDLSPDERRQIREGGVARYLRTSK